MRHPAHTRRRNRFPLLPVALLLLVPAMALLWGRGCATRRPHLRETLPTQTGAPGPSERPSDATLPAATAPQAEDWNLMLVNGGHPLPEGYEPELTQLENGHAVDARISGALQAMLEAARAEGLSPILCSSYRTQEDQQWLFENKTAQYLAQGSSRQEAEQAAAVWVAPPGTSEHQTGLAVDIVSLDYQILDENQEETPEQQWLMVHCWEYGFVLRYPIHKSAVTGISYEPWHYRYVGRQAAEAMYHNDLCLEEYLERLTASSPGQ